MGSKVDLFAAIRRDARVEGMGRRALARKYRVHRRTVAQALASPVPPDRKPRTQSAPKLDLVRDHIDAMLRQDLDAPRKQVQTATRIWNRLRDDHDADVSYGVVRDYVRRRRPEIEAASGKRRVDGFVLQEHAPGAEAEVDFGEVWVVIAGVRTRCHMFAFRLSHSGKAVHRVYATEAQVAFFEGHIVVFEELGGIPVRHIRYDNLTPAVTRVIRGTRERTENSRWVLFRSHYGFDAFYCEPGIDGAHEKGGVEGEVGRFRRAWLSPMPNVDSLDELNAGELRYDSAERRAGTATELKARGISRETIDVRMRAGIAQGRPSAEASSRIRQVGVPVTKHSRGIDRSRTRAERFR